MKKGLTLIEVLITVALVAVLGGIVISALNPVGQIRQARNTERLTHLNTISNAIGQNLADNRGKFICGAASSTIPATSTVMASGGGSYDIAPCLIPVYLSILPVDPSASGTHFTSIANYNTGYSIARNASTGAITLSAPFAELGKTISVTR